MHITEITFPIIDDLSSVRLGPIQSVIFLWLVSLTWHILILAVRCL